MNFNKFLKVMLEKPIGDADYENGLIVDVIGCISKNDTDFGTVLELCRSWKGDPFQVSKVVVAITLGCPLTRAKYWLETVTRPLRMVNEPLDWYTSFAMGVGLGIFQASNRLADLSDYCNDYDQRLCGVIAEMIVYQEEQLRTGRIKKGFWSPCFPFEEYEQALSQAIKRYIRETDHLSTGISTTGAQMRFGQMTKMFALIDERLDISSRENKEIEFGWFANLILDQLFYAVFGNMSTYDRMTTLSSHFR